MLYTLLICNIIDIVTKNAENASAGNRTRIYCLEGNNANLYTTDAVLLSWKWRNRRPLIDVKNFIPSYSNLYIENASAGNRTRIYCLEGNNANLYTTDAVMCSEK